MSIDKSISQSPLGLGALMEQPEEGIEVEIENPDAVNINLGGMEISIIPHGEG